MTISEGTGKDNFIRNLNFEKEMYKGQDPVNMTANLKESQRKCSHEFKETLKRK